MGRREGKEKEGREGKRKGVEKKGRGGYEKTWAEVMIQKTWKESGGHKNSGMKKGKSRNKESRVS